MRENRLDNAFAKDRKRLSIYFTAGYPALDDTTRIIRSLQDAEVDLIEVGIPFSDPVADGETIQKSSQIALENGMTVEMLFAQLEEMKEELRVPIILMGYLNPIYQYGIERFTDDCVRVGVDGLIIPDLPLYDLQSTYDAVFKSKGLKNILLISPQTPPDRVTELDAYSTGFNYLVSSSATTGKTGQISNEQLDYISRVKRNCHNACLVGFGISDKTSFDNVCEVADGAIIGSAFIKALDPNDLENSISTFIKNIKQ